MNFLALCKEVARDSGTLAGGSGEIVTTIGNKVGRIDKIVSWVRDAWVNIQLEHGDWRWMRRDFVGDLTLGKARYTASEIVSDLTRVAVWLGVDDGDPVFTIQDASLTRADETHLRLIDYPTFRARYAIGTHDPARPVEFSIDNDNRLVFGPTPDQAYVVRGMYVATPQVLVEPSEVPEMPEHFHKIIVWEAIKLAGIADEAPFSIQTAVGEYARLRDAMTRELRPRMQISFGHDTVIA